MRTLTILLITLITFATVAVAQSTKDKIEIGVQSTSMTVFPPDVSFDETKGGNYFTREQFSFPEGGQMFQGQFGAKIGKRFDSWGVFGKARPGFVGFSRVLQSPGGVQTGPISFERSFYSSIDVGGVVEFYVSPRWMARFDVGDTIIRYGEIRFPGLDPFFTVPSVTRHNLQVSSGIGFRF